MELISYPLARFVFVVLEFVKIAGASHFIFIAAFHFCYGEKVDNIFTFPFYEFIFAGLIFGNL